MTPKLERFAKAKRNLPEWRLFKAKWDGIPLRGRTLAQREEYRKDAEKLQSVLDAIWAMCD